MILQVTVLVFVLKFGFINCNCKEVPDPFLSHIQNSYRFYPHILFHRLHTACFIEHVNITKDDQYVDLEIDTSTTDYGTSNIFSLNITDSTIPDFSAKPFISPQIACTYGVIRLYVRNASVNHIKAFPIEINPSDCHANYDYIEFTNNNIAKLDGEAFHNLANLSTLDLANNNIKIIGELTFKNLTMLYQLNLSNNNISKIEKIFGKLDSLTSLDLSRNNIANNLSKNDFVNITNLYNLTVSYNQISNIALGTFSHLNQLEILDISHNLLTTIDMSSFSGLHNLKYLFLSNNHIVPNKYLMLHSPMLAKLDLSFNELEKLDLKLFTDHRLNDIYIDGNKFSCQRLIHYIYEFNRIGTELHSGTEKDRLNLRGIHCNDTESNEDIRIDLESDTHSSTGLENFFNKGFMESGFYKFFKRFGVDGDKPNNDATMDDVIKSMETSSRNIASVWNYTMDQISIKNQTQSESNDGERISTDANSAVSKDLQLIVEREINRFDKSADMLNQLISKKYVQAHVPVDHAQAGIFNVLIVIMCILSVIAIVLILNLFLRYPGSWRQLRRKHVNFNQGVSHSELCSITDTL